ncbi:MAG: helix-turn-helix domain-containing protein [Paucimonas sp.]|nr:helix-turn-helix domain-containing protein [Paucimonas sp.]
MAEKASVGERQLSRLFVKHLGVTPSDYYRRVRLEVTSTVLRSRHGPGASGS